jgi:HEAT repeat protein
MSTGKSSRLVTILWTATFALAFGQLARPASANAHAALPSQAQAPDATTTEVNAMKGVESVDIEIQNDHQDSEMQSDGDQEKAEREQEKAEREQEKREREQERAEEKRDREQDRAERLEERYDDGREALDDGNYEKAREKFVELAKENGPQTDAALYWEAYAEQRLGHRQAALVAIADLKARFPQSRWQKDASALEIEVRQNSGQPSRPESQGDDELKMLAIQGLMNSDPKRAMPLLENFLQSSAIPKEKSKALFVLAQSGAPQGREIIGRIARGQSNPELQKKAVEYLGIFGGPDSRKIMAEIYASSTDVSLKRAILKSYMIGGDREHLFAAAKNEKDTALRGEAIRQLGLVGGQNELEQLYKTETSPEIKRELLQAFFLAGDANKLWAAAKDEKDASVRRAAVRNLGLIGSEDSGKALRELYAKETDLSIRKEVLNSLFIQGNATALVAIARAEKDPELRKAAVQKLALMNTKESSDYMMELLQK